MIPVGISKWACADSARNSDHKLGCAEHRISDAQQHAVFERTLDGILLTEPGGRIFAANPAACHILGRTEEELRKLTRSDLVNSGDQRLTAMLGEREQTGRYQGELTLLRGDGSTIEAEVASMAVDHEDGAITTMISRVRQECFSAGFLPKPFAAEVLIQAVRGSAPTGVIRRSGLLCSTIDDARCRPIHT